jgi:hypothetical protein
MSIKEALTGEFENLIMRLEGEGHALAARFRALHDKLIEAAPKVEAEADADAKTIAHDADAAAAPVVAETVHDAKTVAGEATTAVIHAGEYVLSSDAVNRIAPDAAPPAAPAASPDTAAASTTDGGPAAAAEVKP